MGSEVTEARHQCLPSWRRPALSSGGGVAQQSLQLARGYTKLGGDRAERLRRDLSLVRDERDVALLAAPNPAIALMAPALPDEIKAEATKKAR